MLITLVLTLLAPCSGGRPDSPADPYEALAKYKFGQSRQPLALIEEQIRKTAPADYKAIEAKLLAVLKSPQTTKDAKRYICRWLARGGSAPTACPRWRELLTDADLSHPARMALEPQAGPGGGRRPAGGACPSSRASCWPA